MAKGDITTDHKRQVVNIETGVVQYNELTFIEGENGELHRIGVSPKSIQPAVLNADNEWVASDISDHPDNVQDFVKNIIKTEHVHAYKISQGFVNPTGIERKIADNVIVVNASLGIIEYTEITITVDLAEVELARTSEKQVKIVPAFPSNFGGYSYTDKNDYPDGNLQDVLDIVWTDAVRQAYIAAQPENNV